jgi:hypothetical protein
LAKRAGPRIRRRPPDLPRVRDVRGWRHSRNVTSRRAAAIRIRAGGGRARSSALTRRPGQGRSSCISREPSCAPPLEPSPRPRMLTATISGSVCDRDAGWSGRPSRRTTTGRFLPRARTVRWPTVSARVILKARRGALFR